MSPDREARLREIAQKLASRYMLPGYEEYVDAILAALRQTDEEARAEGECAGREQTLSAVKCSQCGEPPTLFDGDYGLESNGMHYCGAHDPAYAWQAGERAGREEEREEIDKLPRYTCDCLPSEHPDSGPPSDEGIWYRTREVVLAEDIAAIRGHKEGASE